MIRETMDDRRLLDRYLATRDEGAFRELVGRHLDFVHAVARRVTGNDELARDAAQAVFVKLARDAAKVPRGLSLAAWLHRTCRCMAIDLVRSEDRRRKREQLAHRNALMNPPPEPAWERLAPLIDEAVDSLPAADRELVLAKYYRNESFAGIATRLGWTEANARKRASRSLEKLRHLLARRGFTTTAATLATVLPAHAVAPAPASLAGAVVAATAEIAPAPVLGLHFAMTTAQKSTALAAALALLASGWAGHALGNARGRVEQPTLATGRSEPAASLVTGRNGRRPVPDDSAASFERLLAGEDRRTWAVVSGLDALSVPRWLEKLRAVQVSTPRGPGEWERLAEIESALYFHWAAADPRSAWADVAAIPESHDSGVEEHTDALVKSVLAAWMRRDADEAYTAAKNHPEHGYTARDMLVLTWTPETLEENLAKHPDKRRDLLGWFCGSVADDEAKREAVIGYLLQQPAPKHADWGRMLLFRKWGYEDFDAAVARAEELELPEMMKLVFQDNLSMSAEKVMPWAISKGAAPGGHQWEKGYLDWLATDPAGARAWFDSNEAVWERQGHHAAIAGFLASEVANALRLNKAGRGDPAVEKAALSWLSEFVSEWQDSDPEAAARWHDTAPKETLDRLAETDAGR
jgi:RNA polymerase sigma factor (sigma-70 family)